MTQPVHPQSSTRGNKAHGPTNTCTRIFIAASLVTAPKWKPPRCPPKNCGLSTQWNIIQPQKGTNVMDESQNRHAEWKTPDVKDRLLYDPFHTKCPEKANPHRQEVDWQFPRTGGGMGWLVSGTGFLPGGWRCLGTRQGLWLHNTVKKYQQTLCFKTVSFRLCEFHLYWKKKKKKVTMPPRTMTKPGEHSRLSLTV